MFIFADRELAKKYFKFVFTEGIYLQYREIFEFWKSKGYTKIVVGYSYNLLALKQILSQGTTK